MRYGRKAFGPGKARSQATKYRHIAESIVLHEGEGHLWTWHQYGLQDQPESRATVQALVTTLRTRERDAHVSYP